MGGEKSKQEHACETGRKLPCKVKWKQSKERTTSPKSKESASAKYQDKDGMSEGEKITCNSREGSKQKRRRT